MAPRLHPPSSRRTRLWMTAGTAYQQGRFCVRYEQYCRSLPARPLADGVQGFLRTLPASQQCSAKIALKRHLGRQALDWGAIETARYHRNDLRLQGSILRAEHRARIRAAVDGPKEAALIECLWTARRAEVAALCWRDIDLGQGMMLVRMGKGGKPSWTLLTPDAQGALAVWFTAAGEPPDETPVFPVPPGVGHPKYAGGPYTPGGIGKIIQKLLTRAGCWTTGAGGCHRFRRTYGTEYLRTHPGDLVGLQKIFRHEQISTTAQYAWLTPDDLAPRMAQVRL